MIALEGLDPAFERRARLAIGALLARHDEISFSAFKQQLAMTDGNLGAQLKKLEDAGYVSARKEFVEKKPVTWYTLTAAGRTALAQHVDALRRVISATPSSVPGEGP